MLVQLIILNHVLSFVPLYTVSKTFLSKSTAGTATPMQSLRRQIYAQQKPDYLYQEIECSLAASGETVASQCDENRHQAEYNHPADRLNDEKTQRSHSWFPRAKRFWQRQRGWHFGVMLAALSTSTVLLLNVILLITTSIVFRNGIEDGIGTAYEGHCHAVSNMATISHVFINILGE